ncbi:DNA translocase FtsK 4TM domain-containing protein [Sphingomonas sp. DG1-23]|uniref:FtsK/SpoIIIE family DNA translocase n=1 Tax=Sphingomonas sp. DG1-23 TaxID=3068316 RepID=UPI00273FD942|nr:DNA translocase FtsK 4TM domain-containing protein [Sphingomonas sp. DG1-23]MDP5280517.1 DNA translocase FtsK 4TM domain-containing protein [Sphingomonas sp. DG1-23]
MASRAQPSLLRDTMKAGVRRSGALIAGTLLFLATVGVVLALLTYNSQDPSLNTASGGPARNLLGLPGAWIADLLLATLGLPVVLIAPAGLILTNRLWLDRPLGDWKRMLRGVVIGVVLMATALAFFSSDSVLWLVGGWGGVVGLSIAGLFSWMIGFIGDPVIVFWMSRGLGMIFALAGLWIWWRSLDFTLPERVSIGMPRLFGPAKTPLLRGPDPQELREPREPREAREPRKLVVPDNRPGPVIAEPSIAPSPARPKPPVQSSLDFKDTYKLPPLDLLKAAPPNQNVGIDKLALERNARLLESVLDDFHVKGQIVEVKPGPVVTMYELEPAAGIKASRVIQLADDIARNMSAISARVATIPGRSVIGIELPNAKRESVNLHELIGSEAFEAQGATLPLVLGKNIAGDPVIGDLAPMPHLLVAGTTGSGKSVGLNAMILSLLYRLTPDQCRMIMIDPKMLELSIYKDIPHLLADVVTDPPKAVRALKWAVEQMEDRYRMMASVNVRSLASFNDKVRQAKAKGQKLGRKVQVGYDPDTGRPIYEEETLDLQPLPQIVVIVDELADLMMTAGKEVEFLIQRLAQKARAAGIHLIMATQRPSVDVITGVIKANLPTRISFHVTSKIDSRTILGEQGAEQLLGKGDMLYMPGGKQIVRVHGPFVSDEEVQAVADFWRAQGAPDYITAVTEEPEDGGFALEGSPDGDDSPEDQLYRRATQLVAESQKASTSWLQRQLRVGYNSAARLVERMEKDGLVSRPDHVGRREVLMDTDGRPL